METLKTLLIGAVALLAAACATEPTIPVTADSGTPAVAEAEGSRLGVVELKQAHRGAQL